MLGLIVPFIFSVFAVSYYVRVYYRKKIEAIVNNKPEKDMFFYILNFSNIFKKFMMIWPMKLPGSLTRIQNVQGLIVKYDFWLKISRVSGVLMLTYVIIEVLLELIKAS